MVEAETTMILAITVDNNNPTMVPWKVVAALVAEVQAVPMVVNTILYRRFGGGLKFLVILVLQIYTLFFVGGYGSGSGSGGYGGRRF